MVPGVGGGGNWNGAAIDPETGTLYVGTVRLPFVVTIRKPRPFEGSYDFIGEIRYLSGPRGLPLLKPPFGSMVAINMNSGEHRWRIPVGDSKAVAPIRNLGIQERLGLPGRSWALVTKTVLFVVQMGYFGPPHFVPALGRPISDLNNRDPHMWVYVIDGEEIAQLGDRLVHLRRGVDDRVGLQKQLVVGPIGRHLRDPLRSPRRSMVRPPPLFMTEPAFPIAPTS